MAQDTLHDAPVGRNRNVGAILLLVAVGMVHLSGGFFAPAGFEYPLTLLVASIGLGLTGSGAFAVDSLLFKRSTSSPSLAGTPSLGRAA